MAERKGDGVIEYIDAKGVTHYRIQWRDSDGRQVKETIGSEADGWTRKRAAKVRQERVVDVRREGMRRPAGATFSDFAERFRKDHLPTRGLKRNTMSNWNYGLDKHLIAFFGDYRLPELERRPEIIERFIGKMLADGYSAKTVRNELANLSRMMVVARRWKLIRSNPVELVDAPKVPRYEPFILDEEAIATYLQAYRTLEGEAENDARPWWALSRRVVTVGLASAMRRGELFALRWERVSMLEGTAYVAETWTRNAFDTPKSDTSYRTVALGPVALAALTEQWEASRFREDSDLVFCHPKLGTVLDPSKLTREYVRPAMRKAKIPETCRPWHDLRHTALTHDAAIHPQAVVQAKAGHSQPSVTARYVHLAKVKLDGVAEASEARLFGRVDA